MQIPFSSDVCFLLWVQEWIRSMPFVRSLRKYTFEAIMKPPFIIFDDNVPRCFRRSHCAGGEGRLQRFSFV